MTREPRSIDAVLFDFHFTLVRQRDSRAWLSDALVATGVDGLDGPSDAAEVARLLDGLDRIWELADRIDPQSGRDLDPRRHRLVFHEVVRSLPGVDGTLAEALYATLLDVWTPYPDTLPVLRTLRERGVRTAVLSNVGIDVRPVLRRTGIAELVDAVVLSYEHGFVKPDPRLFARALQEIGATAERTLMVGDSWRDDAAAARLGLRTLVLPATPGGRNGLQAVPHLVSGFDEGL